MTVDLNDYLVNKSFIQKWYDDHGKGDPILTVSILSPATHCPCVVMAMYLAEHVGFTEDLNHMIKSLINFYGYRVIKNQPDNSPFREYS